MKKAIISFLLLVVLFDLFTNKINAAEEVYSDWYYVGETEIYNIQEDFSERDLYSEYIEMLLTNEISDNDVNVSVNNEIISSETYNKDYSLGNYGVSDKSKLNIYEKSVYEIFKAEILDISSGNKMRDSDGGISTIITYKMDNKKGTFYMDEIGLADSLKIEREIDRTTAYNSAREYLCKRIDFVKIWNYLRIDCPEILYWHDYKFTVDYPAHFEYDDKLCITAVVFDEIKLTFYVNKAFAVSNNGSYDNTRFDTQNIDVVKSAIANARAIVDKYKDVSDYEKLYGYLMEICRRTSYNHAAADEDDFFDTNHNPWQIIYVFDEEPSDDVEHVFKTNVVCEGYSKAFQYLCDLTTFTNESIKSYLATGVTASDSGSGRHMWNIVSINNTSYLVDVTNCDGNSIGNPDQLFLASLKGNINDGYIFNSKIYGANSLQYTYDDDTLMIYDDDLLIIANEELDGITECRLNLKKVEAIPSSCDFGGKKEYWICQECGSLFGDCKAEKTVTHDELLIDEYGHSFTKYMANGDATCVSYGTKTAVCDRDGCNAIDTVIGDNKDFNRHVETTTSWIINSLTHEEIFNCCHVSKLENSIHTYGIVDEEYYTCGICGYINDERKNELESKSTDLISRGTCGESAVWTLNESGLLRIYGMGEMWDFEVIIDDETDVPWIDNIYDIKDVIIEEGITSIGANSFRGCLNLQSVTFPDSLEIIDVFAFVNCSSLCNFSLPQNLKSICQQAFFGCSSLTEAIIPGRVTFLDSEIFGNCSRLESLTIDWDKDFAWGSYMYCNNVPFTRGSSMTSNIKVASTHPTLFDKDGVLYGKVEEGICLLDYPNNRRVNQFTVMDGVTSIGSFVFENNPSIKSLSIPNSVNKIGESNFSMNHIETIVMNDVTLEDDCSLISYLGDDTNGGYLYGGFEDEKGNVIFEFKKGIRYSGVFSRVKAGQDKWVQESNGWKYMLSNGLYLKACWNSIDGKLYYFNESGYRVTGWQQNGGVWYYFNTDGEMATSIWISGIYYVKEDGKMATNEWVDGNRYYVDENGVYVPGKQRDGVWKSNSIGYWYENADGSYPINSFKEIEGKTYYFNGSGYRATDWQQISGVWYYFNTDGEMATSIWISGIYYVKEDGKMATNEWVDGNRYYVDENGVYVPGKQRDGVWKSNSIGYWYENADGSYPINSFKEIEGKTYYFNGSGYRATDWQQISGVWYYFNTDGEMATSIWISGIYYVKEDGKMATNEWVDGNRYYVDENGVYVPGKQRDGVWKSNSIGYWYENADGSYPINSFKEIEGKTYYFNGSGYRATDWQQISGVWYYFNTDGEMATSIWISGIYYVKEDGKMATNEWVDGERYFVDVNGCWVPGMINVA